MQNTGLNKYKKNITSQWGEDGIIAEIFKRIGEKNKICVEFGADDGIELSNTFNLWKNKKWRAILIESDNIRFQKLTRNTEQFSTVKVLHQFVTAKGSNSLNNILKKQRLPKNIDLISIDIDSNDYYIFENLVDFQPRVLVIEHNPTIPPEIQLVQNLDEEDRFGSSALSNLELAHQKGYKLVAMTHTNGIYVHKSEFSKLKLTEPLLEAVFDRSGLSYILSSYNGNLFLKTTHGHPSYSFIPKYNLVTVGYWMIKEYIQQTFRLPKPITAISKPVKIFQK